MPLSRGFSYVYLFQTCRLFTGTVMQRWRRGGSRAGPVPGQHPRRVQACLGDRRRHVADGRDFTVCANTQTCGEGRTFKAAWRARKRSNPDFLQSQSADLTPPRRPRGPPEVWLETPKAVAWHRMGLVILCVGCPQKAKRPKRPKTLAVPYFN